MNNIHDVIVMCLQELKEENKKIDKNSFIKMNSYQYQSALGGAKFTLKSLLIFLSLHW